MPYADINDLIFAMTSHNLQDEIYNVLSSSTFSFAGTFFHASLLSNPPNPCLTVEGVGILGLPLGERDAKAIIECSTSASTITDKETQNTWEIDASKISFADPAWEDYVNSKLCSMLCDSLGVILSPTSPPKMELRKLFLCGIGSQFSSNQGALADGVFGRVSILLPSAYTGGKITLSHSSSTKTIDFDQPPLISTSLLAWYSKTKCDVEPIESGFRLGLSYDLVQDNAPLPGLPDMANSMDQLRRVFSWWRDQERPLRFIAYPLNRRYPVNDLIQGVNVLKGVDLHRVMNVRYVAEKLGFRVCLASLDHKISGLISEDGDKYYRTPRYSIQDHMLEKTIPKLRKVFSTDTTISGLVNLDDLSVLSSGNIKVGKGCLAPAEPFNPDQAPDEARYCGNCKLDYWYHRTCLVLMRKEEVDRILYSSEGAPYVIRILKNSTSNDPTPYHRQWVDHLLQDEKPVAEPENILALLEISIKWKDVRMWNSILNNPHCTLPVVNLDILKNSMEIFGFDALRSSLEILLQRSTEFSQKIEFILEFSSIPSATENEAVKAWSRGEINKIASSYPSSPEIKDIQTMVRSLGREYFEEILVPNLRKMEKSYAFCIALVKTLIQNRQATVEPVASRATQLGIITLSDAGDQCVDGLIRQCLRMALPQWTVQRRLMSPHSPYTWDAKVDSIIEIIEQALALPDLDICKELFVDILKYQDPERDKFEDIYMPLTRRLRTSLEAQGQEVSQQPFVSFFQVVIGLYLRDVLGKKGNLPNVNLRNIGCGCKDCKDLDSYFMDHKKEFHIIEVAKVRRLHLEGRLEAAHDLCTFETFPGCPYSLRITKTPAVIVVSKWVSKQKDAKKFLASIGTDNDISRIMGNRYGDVRHAIDGMRSFGAVLTNVAPSSSSNGSAGSAPAIPEVPTSTTKTSTTTLPQGPTLDQSTSVSDLVPIPTSSLAGVPRHVSETDFAEQNTEKRRKFNWFD